MWTKEEVQQETMRIGGPLSELPDPDLPRVGVNFKRAHKIFLKRQQNSLENNKGDRAGIASKQQNPRPLYSVRNART